MICMGVDIESGSPASRALYSVALVDSSGRLVDKYDSVPLSRLVRIAWEKKPAVIAFDNIFEIAESKKKLTRILSILPLESRIVQVTVSQDGLKSVKQIARETGLSGDYKLTPSRTAFLLAVLSCQGYGEDVRVVEERTVVHVSGRRPGSKGGWSQQRYQRRIRAVIQNVAESIKEALDRAGLDYDYSYRESRGGIDSAVFTVYAPASRVREVIPRIDSQSVAVKVKPIVKSKLSLGRRGDSSERLVIVGVDPGMTIGLAIVDATSGEVLYIGSGRNVDRGSIIDIVAGYGKPAIVATDVSEPAEAVKKLAAQIGASLYSPPYDLSVIEKHELTLKYRHMISNTHERDALAAAIKAYRVIRSRIRKVEEIASKLSIDLDLSEVKRELLRGVALADALEKVIEKAIEEEQATEVREVQENRQDKCEIDVSHYIVKIEEMRERNRVLESQIAVLEEKIRELEGRLKAQHLALKTEIMRDAEVEALRSRVRELEREVEKLREKISEYDGEKSRLEELLGKLARGEATVAFTLPSLTSSSLKEASGFKIITVKNPGTFEEEAIRQAIASGVECVVLRSIEMDSPLARALVRLGLPAVRRDEFEIAEYKNLVFLASSVNSICQEEKRKIERSKRAIDLERVVEEYRRSLLKQKEH